MVSIKGLSVDIDTPEGTAHILRNVSMDVPRGQTLGIVGESGSGKSMTLRTMLGLLPADARVRGGMWFDGEDLTAMAPEPRRKLLGRRVGVVFQNPMTSLNPVVTIGRQMGEAVRFHLGYSKAQARELSIQLLEQVGIANAANRLRDYPHQFSGGMRQRVMIAMALTCSPDLIIADEATTALDVTIQKGILDLLQEIQRERNMAMIIVSHDLSVVAGRTDDVVVMYGGRVVDRRPTARLFAPPMHPYTRALSMAIPRLDMPAHTRLPALGGRPPSVYDPLLTEEEADARDMDRWSSVSETIVDDSASAPDVVAAGAGPTAGEQVIVGTLAAEQEAGVAEGGDAEVAHDTLYAPMAREDEEAGR
nr:ABC transporter ATP-binding protein [Microbacterium thalassium]